MRKAALAMILSLSLITAGFAVPVITDAAKAQVHARFHGGGMGTFNRPNGHSDFLYLCDDPICIGIVGWAIGRILDSAANTPCSKVPAGGCDNYPAHGPTGGGGGDAF